VSLSIEFEETYNHINIPCKNLKDIHDKTVEDMAMLRTQGVEAVQDNELDVVI